MTNERETNTHVSVPSHVSAMQDILSYDHHNFFPAAARNLRDCKTRQRRKNLRTVD